MSYSHFREQIQSAQPDNSLFSVRPADTRKQTALTTCHDYTSVQLFSSTIPEGFGEDCGLILPTLGTCDSPAVGPNSFLFQPLPAEHYQVRSGVFNALDCEFLSSLTPKIRLFLKERRDVKLEDVASLADCWASAHNAYPKDSTSLRPKKLPPRAMPPSKQIVSSPKKPAASTVKCHNCGEEGHIRPRCPKNPRALKDHLTTTTPQYTIGFYIIDGSVPFFTVTSTINGSRASTIIRDTGCFCVVVSEEVTVRASIKLAIPLVGNIPGINDPR
ncbi:hypothetical protein O3P69_009774 [Scylla paramamosain]|uniref:CCHC-type domain-containing protein n=1 Tax=Scylla paramamosain TaxID=85552 RepID=A0AAW0SNJ3_SCYPA